MINDIESEASRLRNTNTGIVEGAVAYYLRLSAKERTKIQSRRSPRYAQQ